jgi:hypothetical protein
VLLVVLLLGGAYLVKTQLLDSSDDTSALPPVVHHSAAPKPLTPAQLAGAMTDPHFKHGYDAGKARAARGGAVPAAQRESACRAMALAERAKGYPWGAHDRAGCLIGIAG